MITISDFQDLNNLQIFEMPALKAAKIIEDKIFVPLEKLFYVTSTSDLINLYSQKIKTILENLNSDLQILSSRFWNRSIEEPIISEEVLAVLVLKFLTGMNDSKDLKNIFSSLSVDNLMDLLIF